MLADWLQVKAQSGFRSIQQGPWPGGHIASRACFGRLLNAVSRFDTKKHRTFWSVKGLVWGDLWDDYILWRAMGTKADFELLACVKEHHLAPFACCLKSVTGMCLTPPRSTGIIPVPVNRLSCRGGVGLDGSSVFTGVTSLSQGLFHRHIFHNGGLPGVRNL